MSSNATMPLLMLAKGPPNEGNAFPVKSEGVNASNELSFEKSKVAATFPPSTDKSGNVCQAWNM
jgi:hypothetical protein